MVRQVIRASSFRLVRPLLPLRPILAFPSFRRMHRFPAKLLREPLRVRLLGEPEDLIPFLLPDDGMTVFRKGEPVRPAELPVLLKVRTDALLLDECDPVRKTSLRSLLYARLAMRHWPTSRSRSAHSSSTLASIRRRPAGGSESPSAAGGFAAAYAQFRTGCERAAWGQPCQPTREQI
jgi:hypothetical protein